MKTNKQITKLELLLKNGYKTTVFARRAGVTRDTLYRLIATNGTEKFKAKEKTLEKIYKALNDLG